MPTIQEIRQQYPQYSDLSDQQLADALHSKYYSDMPQQQFYQKIGFSTQAQNNSPQQPATNNLPAPLAYANNIEQGLINNGKDILSGAAKGGHQVLNAPSNIANYLASKGIISNGMAGMVPRQQDYNYDAMLGINNPTFADKALQFVPQVAPLVAGGEAEIGRAHV